MSVLIFILVLSFLVIIHELGHFLVAKWRGVKVEEFGLGYPPKLFTLFRWKGSEFSLNAVPFGGFVRMEGEDGGISSMDDETQLSGKVLEEEPFYKKSALSRMLIILAGPFINFLFGIVAFSLIFSYLGVPTSLDGQPRVEMVVPDSPAAKAGLPVNVNIVGFYEGEQLVETKTIQEVQDFVSQHRSETVKMSVSGECQRDICSEQRQEFDMYLRSQEETPADEGTMGVVFAESYFKEYSWYEKPVQGVIYGIKQAVFMGVVMVQALGEIVMNLLAGRGAGADVAGPVGIVYQAQKSNLAGEGFLTILSFSGMLSINLAIMNLLPIPALDGGRAFFIILEKILGKKRVGRIEGYANYGGYIFLLGLIISITIKDIWQIIF